MKYQDEVLDFRYHYNHYSFLILNSQGIWSRNSILFSFLLLLFRQLSKIVEGLVEDWWKAGTATLCGGMLMELDQSRGEEKNDGNWAVVCANVGDCKALLYSAKTGEFHDITKGNR
tara:strand:+ start:1285 stop:1632 length:348 start_codon:yes stop_codon:yes gene_type:complete